jgi:uncharacterized protein (TIGR03083 family)
LNRAQLLDTIRAERGRWDAILSGIDEKRMSEPGVAGAWSVKDIVAHITWSERETVGMLQARALVGSDLWELPQDQRNAAVFEMNRQRQLYDVLTEARDVFQQLLDAVEALTDEDLVDPKRFRGMPGEWQPWRVIASNSYEHYAHHARDIRSWLAESGESS